MSILIRWLIGVVVVIGIAGTSVYFIDTLTNDLRKKELVEKVVDTPAAKPVLPLITGTGFTEKIPLKQLESDSNSNDDVVHLAAVDPYVVETFSAGTPLIVRELYRQGLLIAARDELGLTTRDEVLGQKAPSDLALPYHLRLNVARQLSKQGSIKLEYGPEAASRVAWHIEEIQPLGEHDSPTVHLKIAEKFSREQFKMALSSIGIQSKKRPAKNSVPLPKSIEDQLSQMAFIPQMLAVRDLHDHQRRNGENQASLSALVRGYANLSMITDRQWDGMMWVFKARALLYAERLCQQYPKEAIGYWSRAYAAAIYGMHQVALDALKAADNYEGSLQPPHWVELISLFCRFDVDGLEKIANSTPANPLAGLLAYIASEDPTWHSRQFQVAKRAFAQSPMCYRISESIASLLGVGVKNPLLENPIEHFAERYFQSLKQIPHLPMNVQESLTKENEREINQRLVASSDERQDQGELTWGLIGKYAQETRLVCISKHVWFFTNYLSRNGTTAWNHYKGFVEDHPHAKVIELFTFPQSYQHEGFIKRLEETRIPELSSRHPELLGLYARFMNRKLDFESIASGHGQGSYYDQAMVISRLQPNKNFWPVAKQLLAISPYSPVARAELLANQFDSVSKNAQIWEKEVPHPKIYSALARHAINDNQFPEAVRLASAAVKLSPTILYYEELAKAYARSGQPEKYAQTMDEFIQIPDQGLLSVRACEKVANFLMSRKDYQQAKKYSEMAADSGASWGLDCHARCLTGLGDFVNAEKLILAMHERYGSHEHSYYFWCLRSGQGNLAQATQLMENVTNRMQQNPGTYQKQLIGIWELANGRTAKAAHWFHLAGSTSEQFEFRLYAALERASLVDNLSKQPPNPQDYFRLSPSVPYYYIFEIANRVITKQLKKLPADDVINSHFKVIPEENHLMVYYILGKLYSLTNQQDKAREFYQRIIDQHLPSGDVLAMLAKLQIDRLK